MKDPYQDPERRHDSNALIVLSQKFSDFVERYDRDVGALSEWRKVTDHTLKTQDEILKDIFPAYRRGIWVIGLIVIASVGMAVKAFLSHFSWN